MLSFLVEDWLGKCFILFVRSLVVFFFFCFLFRCWAWFAIAVILWFIFNFRYQTMGLRSLLCIYVYSIELRTEKKNRCRGLFKWEFLQSRTSISVNDLTARLQSANMHSLMFTILSNHFAKDKWFKYACDCDFNIWIPRIRNKRGRKKRTADSSYSFFFPFLFFLALGCDNIFFP